MLNILRREWEKCPRCGEFRYEDYSKIKKTWFQTWWGRWIILPIAMVVSIPGAIIGLFLFILPGIAFGMMGVGALVIFIGTFSINHETKRYEGLCRHCGYHPLKKALSEKH